MTQNDLNGAVPGNCERHRFWKITSKTLIGIAAAQVGAVGVVYAIDAARKRRIPGGVKGFPTVAPTDTQVAENSVRLYTEGESLYADQLKAIENAKSSIYFETYVWRSDEVGRAFKDALVAAAERGVEVYIFYDGFGSLKSSARFKRFPKLPTLHVHKLHEIRRGLFVANLRRTGRTHRKLLVVDDHVGFVGGFNVGVDFGTEWRDSHIRLLGPGVGLLVDGFRSFWNTYRTSEQPELEDWQELPWTGEITAAFNLPSALLFPVRGQYLDTFRRARETLQITSAYFIPDREMTHELVRAAGRGVKVQVLIPEFSNHILADWVGRPRYGELLEAGVEIWLYQHAMIHAKTVTADGYRSIVGTANVDRLSMAGNYEITVQIDSEEFAHEMEEVFAKDLTTARKLELEEWQSRNLGTRLLERLVSPFSFIV